MSPTTWSQLMAAIDHDPAPGAIEALIPTALAQAEQADSRRAQGQTLGPLDGLVFAVKSNFDVAGLPTSSGLIPTLARPAASDAFVIELLTAAGAIAGMTTTMAPMAIGAITESAALGPCVNPRDPTLHAGGSSGGSGAVVGAGLVQFALGSDTMGSVRIPAAYCGVYGWLPTHGAVSARGMTPLAPSMDSVGVLARDPRVLIDVADAILRFDRDFPWSRDVAATTSTDYPAHIALCDWASVANESSRRAVTEVVDLMQSWGSTTVDPITFSTSVDLTPDRIRRHGLLVVEASACNVFGEPWQRDLMTPSVRSMLDYAEKASAARLWQSVDELVGIRRSIRNALTHVDCLVLPTTPQSAPVIGDDPVHAADLTAWVNVAGLPAVAVPWQGTSVQLIGQPGSDRNLLRWAAKIDDYVNFQTPEVDAR